MFRSSMTVLLAALCVTASSALAQGTATPASQATAASGRRRRRRRCSSGKTGQESARRGIV